MPRTKGYQIWTHNNWPEPDRSAWVLANTPGDEFDAGGRASEWTPLSRENVERAYGRYLDFLNRSDLMKPVGCVGDRLDLNHIRSFACELSDEVAGSTVWSILQALSRALSAMAPEADRRKFHQVLTRIKRRTRLTRKVDHRLIKPDSLVTVGMQMMDEADQRSLGKKAAVLYRNGAIIVGAALCPLRRDAWSRVEIGRHLRLIDNQAWLDFEADELKSAKRAFRIELPREYVARLDRYMSTYRPLLMASSKTDCHHLWVSWMGTPLSATLSAAVTTALKKRCAKDFSFHMFRHSAATFIEDVAPEKARMAAGVLQHADFRSTRKHYIRGERVSAVKRYQSIVRDIVDVERRAIAAGKKRRLHVASRS